MDISISYIERYQAKPIVIIAVVTNSQLPVLTAVQSAALNCTQKYNHFLQDSRCSEVEYYGLSFDSRLR